ncbi:MAG: hypothetical protein HQK56_09500 [Deltaproteobacteria bacterium]|nr:hypothetical protein [Deltaproteobacteria bacterium]
MKCDHCRTDINQSEEREHLGRTLCEDCYMDALSPTKTCDPWAVYSATSLERHMGRLAALTPIQTEVLGILTEAGDVEATALLQALGGKLTMPQLEREFATLRHMEKVRAEKREGKIFIRLF